MPRLRRMKPDKPVLLVISALLLFLSVQAQSYNAQQIELAEQLHTLARRAPPERAYIQTSKDIYETGEDLWFKVYLLNSQYLTPSLLSRTLYLQLFSEDKKHLVWQEKYEINAIDGVELLAENPHSDKRYKELMKKSANSMLSQK